MCCSKVIIWRIIAITSMLISCIMIAIAIGGLLTYHCTFNSELSIFRKDNFYLIYTVYFFNNKCIDASNNYQEEFPYPSERTWGWMIAYLVLNTLWFFSSLLLFNATNYWRTSTSLCLTYPWLFITFILLCTDVAASVMYALDFQSIETLEKLYGYLGLDAFPESTEFGHLSRVQDIETFVYVPVSAIIMVAIFSKVIIGWFLVFISFITIFLLLIKVSKSESLMLETRPPVDYYYNSAVTNPGFEMSEIQQPDSLQYLQRNGHLSFVDIPLDGNTPQLIPRPTLHTTRREEGQQDNYNRQLDLNQINADYFSDDWNQDYRGQSIPQSPRSILKSQQNNRLSSDLQNQKPWSYLASSQPSSMESEHRHHVPPTQTYYY